MTKKAWEIPCGNLVVLRRDGAATLCLKTHRVGKEYVHHYVVPLRPRAEEFALLYLDPDDELDDLERALAVGPGAESDARPEPGDVFSTPRGTFLKVIEDPKSQKTFTFIDVATGEMHRRRERDVRAVYRDWRATAKGADDELSLEKLHDTHCVP